MWYPIIMKLSHIAVLFLLWISAILVWGKFEATRSFGCSTDEANYVNAHRNIWHDLYNIHGRHICATVVSDIKPMGAYAVRQQQIKYYPYYTMLFFLVLVLLLFWKHSQNKTPRDVLFAPASKNEKILLALFPVFWMVLFMT